MNVANTDHTNITHKLDRFVSSLCVVFVWTVLVVTDCHNGMMLLKSVP